MYERRIRLQPLHSLLTRDRRRLAILTVLLGTGCADSGADPEPPAAVVESVPGSDVKRLVLTERAVARLGIATAAVSPDDRLDAADRSVPYAAVVYEPNGDAWVYTNPTPLTYVREPVTVHDVDGDVALLSAGPATGAQVVTIGVAELYGTEHGIGQ